MSLLRLTWEVHKGQIIYTLALNTDKIQLEEKDKASKSFAMLFRGALRNERGTRFGFRIANCARRIRSSTMDLSLMGSPKISFLVLNSARPYSSTVKRSPQSSSFSSPEKEKDPLHYIASQCPLGIYSNQDRSHVVWPRDHE